MPFRFGDDELAKQSEMDNGSYGQAVSKDECALNEPLRMPITPNRQDCAKISFSGYQLRIFYVPFPTITCVELDSKAFATVMSPAVMIGM
jgi:hypothetical protein